MPRSALSFEVNSAFHNRISPSSFCQSVARLQFASSKLFFFRHWFLGPFPGLVLCLSDTTSFGRESCLHCGWTAHLQADLGGDGHQFLHINLGMDRLQRECNNGDRVSVLDRANRSRSDSSTARIHHHLDVHKCRINPDPKTIRDVRLSFPRGDCAEQFS